MCMFELPDGKVGCLNRVRLFVIWGVLMNVKNIIIFMVVASLGYLFLSEYKNDRLIDIICARNANKETRRVWDEGIRVRDRVNEALVYDRCVGEIGGSSLLDLLVKYVNREI